MKNKKYKYISYPDYSATNPYQKLVSATIPDVFERDYDDIQGAIKNAGDGCHTVFHLHWTPPIFAEAHSAQAYRQRADWFIAKIRHFKKLGGLFVWTVHNSLPHSCRQPHEEALFRSQLSEHAEYIHVHNLAALEHLRSLYRLPEPALIEASHGHYIGVYPDQQAGSEPEHATNDSDGMRTRIGLIGQIRAYKGYDLLLEAARRSPDRAYDLFLFGKTDHTINDADLKDRCRVVGVEASLGFVPDEQLSGIYGTLDCVVLPYKDILTSGGAILALSLGKPVILPELPGLSNLFHLPGVFTFEPNDVSALIRALEKAADIGSAKLRALGKSAAEAVRDFDWQEAFTPLFRALTPEARRQQQQERQAQLLGFWRGTELVSAYGRISAPVANTALCVVGHHSVPDIRLLIRSALRHEHGSSYQFLILLSEGSADETRLLAHEFPNALVFQARNNTGYAAGNNALLDFAVRAGFENAFILNPDTHFVAPILETMKSASKLHPDSFLAPMLVTGGSAKVDFLRSVKRVTDNGLIVIDRPERDVKAPDITRSERIVALDSSTLNGAAMFGPLRLFEKAGAIPEDYFLYFEETEWCLKATEEHGIRCKILPQLRLVHMKASQVQGLPSLPYLYYFLRNSALFQNRLNGNADEALRHVNAEFVNAWRAKIAKRAPETLGIFDRITTSAFEAAKAGETGARDIAKILNGHVEKIVGKPTSVRYVYDAHGIGSIHLKGVPCPLGSGAIVSAREMIPVLVQRQDDDILAIVPRAPFRFPPVVTKEIWLLWSAQKDASGPCAYWTAEPDKDDLNRQFMSERAVPKSLAIKAQLNSALSDMKITGHAQSNANSGAPVKLDLHISGEYVSTLTCDGERVNADGQRVYDGFEAPIPYRFLDRGTCTVTVVEPGTRSYLASEKICLKTTLSEVNSLFDLHRWAFLNGSYPPEMLDHKREIRDDFDVSRSLAGNALSIPGSPDLRFTVVMPVWNRHHCIERALASILDQKYQNWECVIADDGSIDGSADIAEAWAERERVTEKIRVIRLEKNSGVSAARNAALKVASGDVIAYLDSDNWWYSDYLLASAIAYGINPEKLSTYTGQDILEYDADGQIMNRSVRMVPFNRSVMERKSFIDLNVFTHRRIINGSAVTFNEHMRRLVDWDLILRVTGRQAPAFIPMIGGAYVFDHRNAQITRLEPYEDNLVQIGKKD